MTKEFSKLEKHINYEFKNIELLETAMTHRSYVFEHKIQIKDNQRMEFLGDAVLELIVSERLFNDYPNMLEGDMTKIRSALTRKEAFVKIAEEIQLGIYIRLGKGEKKQGGATRPSTLCDAFESLIAAIFLDSDYKKTYNVFWPLASDAYQNALKLLAAYNPKGQLQELTQAKFASIPEYVVKDIKGPEHIPEYVVSVSIKGKEIAFASASNRKDAETKSAFLALQKLI